MIRFDREICTNLDAALSREWLETNGLGGYASSTIACLNTRRYHGLMVAATQPPVGRIVMLSKLEETLVVDGRRYDLSANQYPNTIYPQGYKYQIGFRLDPYPIITYEIEGVMIEKSIFMIHGENTTVVQYQIVEEGEATANRQLRNANCILEVRPLIAFRDYHSLGHENPALNSEVEFDDDLATIKPYPNLPALCLAHDAQEIDRAAFWFRNFEYDHERARGFDFKEDLFSPFALKFHSSESRRATVIASTGRRDARLADHYKDAEVSRRAEILAGAPADDEFVRALVSAADQFIVARSKAKTVIAGYHWFSDWGRDTMIALPGVTLATKRPEIAGSILLEFARHVDRGMLPNRFPDAGETPEYNTVDATLWFFEAVRAFLHYSGDEKFVRANLYDVLVDIVERHVKGTRYNIHLDAQGLIYSGEEGVQLTWMDAKVGDWVVTPRRGLAVEIQALWYNAVRVMEDLAGRFGDGANQKRYAELATRAKQSFNEMFWNEDGRYLNDVIDGDRRDASLRPNQIFAVSLLYSMLSDERAKRVVEVVEHALLTPYGLRSLAPDDPRYRPRYEGDSLGRDGAYHQGTVWAWLMGPFITAYLKVHNGSEPARAHARSLLSNLREHLNHAGLGQVSEIFDGDPPHAPRGCIAQAWSVGELLRVAVEELK
ncbi:MAG: hypothetical protein QOJ64_4499 [Acidobacteriota bacterium]|jgi:predicted glycogen debranching enzyme|nr:hypothetical protein [Acidobacteriota bacterium]